jgi:hypothetical protein
LEEGYGQIPDNLDLMGVVGLGRYNNWRWVQVISADAAIERLNDDMATR